MKIDIDIDSVQNKEDLNNFVVYFNSCDPTVGSILVHNYVFDNYVVVDNDPGDGLNIHIKDFTKFVKIVTMMEAKLKELGKID